MTVPNPPQDTPVPKNLATAGLPRRVRRTLERALGLFAEELERNLVATVTEFEEELFRLADRTSGSSSSADHMQSLRVVRLNRHDLVPRFMQLLEGGLAGLRSPGVSRPVSMTTTPAHQPSFRNLSLVENSVMDEGAVLHEIASRQESRAGLVLHLLGQRFGVLAAAPAFDSERMPLGPQAICRAMRDASQTLQLEQEPRLLFYRIFDRRVMTLYPQLSEKLDALLLEEGVLPGLTYVPMRTRATPQGTIGELGGEPDTLDAQTRDATGEGHAGGRRPSRGESSGGFAPQAGQGRPQESGAASPSQTSTGPRRNAGYDPNGAFTSWMGQPVQSDEAVDEQAAYHDLQTLLSNHRRQTQRPPSPGQPPAAALPTGELLRALGQMSAEPQISGDTVNLADVKRALLAQARQQTGKAVELSQSDNDTFELVNLLYTHLQGEIREDSPTTALVKRLQLTLLQVALQDRAFFVRPNHPARQLLNTVSETAAKWLGEDDFDPQLLAPLQKAVTHAVKNYDGNVAVFEESNKELQTHISQQVRKAETLERRHIEAARGKEKLEVAKRRADEVLTEILGDQPLPKFTRALLKQAWADVLTLTYLRQGEGSEEWQRQLDATRQIIAVCTQRDPNVEYPALKSHIESALKLVGYHEDEADVIARRLSSGHAEEDAEGESRTELSIKLKAHARLGDDSSKTRKPDLPPRTPHEQECYEQLKLLPFGTWIEFVTNQQGDVVRRRMSWFSPVTDNALFVNQRGQRIGEHSLDSLARMMDKDQVRIVTVQRAGLVDRAWHAALNALRTLTGRREDHEGGHVQDEDPPPMPNATSESPAASAHPSTTKPAAKHEPKHQPIIEPTSQTPPPSQPVLPPIGLIGDESAPMPAALGAASLSKPLPQLAPQPESKPPLKPPLKPVAAATTTELPPIGLIGDESAPPPSGGDRA